MINTNLPLKYFQMFFWDSVFLVFLGIFESSQPPAAFAEGEKEPILLATGIPISKTTTVKTTEEKSKEEKIPSVQKNAADSSLLAFVAKPVVLLPATPETKTPNGEKSPLSDNVSPKAQPQSGERHLPFIVSATLRPFEEAPDPEAGIPGPSPSTPPSQVPSPPASSGDLPAPTPSIPEMLRPDFSFSAAALGYELYNNPRLIAPEKKGGIPFLDVADDSLLHRLIDTGLKYRNGPIDLNDRWSLRVKLRGLRGARISVKYEF